MATRIMEHGVSDASAGEGRGPALVLAGRRAVTALRSASGHLLLISWEMPGGLARITRAEDGGRPGGGVDLVAAAAVDSLTLVTASRDGAGRLLLVSWRLHPDGSFTRLSDSGTQAGAVGLCSLIALGGPSRLVLTAVRTTRRTLKVVAWSVSETGAIVRHRGDGETDEPVAGVSSARLLDADREPVGIVTAAEAPGGTLRVTAWTMAGEGAPSGFVVSLRNGSGDLMLVPAAEGATRSGSTREAAIVGFLDGRAVRPARPHDLPFVHPWNVVPDPAFERPTA